MSLPEVYAVHQFKILGLGLAGRFSFAASVVSGVFGASVGFGDLVLDLVFCASIM